MDEEPFLEWIKLGKIRIEKGTIQFLNAFNLLFPVSCILKLNKILKEKIGEKEAEELLKELGRFQIKQALVRYVKLLGIKELEKQRIEDFGETVFKVLGYGELQITTNYQEKRITLKSENLSTAVQYKLMFGNAEKPIDAYLCGIFEEVGTSMLGVITKCIEVKCIACGDPYCQFEVFPAEEKKESKT